MEGSWSVEKVNKIMEQDSNPSGLCKMGCGFYGNHSYEGMCSKCFKDQLKKQQQATANTVNAGRSTPPSGKTSTTTSNSSSNNINNSKNNNNITSSGMLLPLLLFLVLFLILLVLFF